MLVQSRRGWPESLPHSHANKVPWGLGDSERPTSGLSGYTCPLANLDTEGSGGGSAAVR